MNTTIKTCMIIVGFEVFTAVVMKSITSGILRRVVR
jgi:hypothetical protein